jgi:hypothetical protein
VAGSGQVAYTGGKVLVGTSNAAPGMPSVGGCIGLAGGSSGGRKIDLYQDTNVHMGLGVDIGGGPYEYSIYYPAGNSSNGTLRFGVVSHANPGTWTEAARFTADGYFRLASKGIQFNSDTADANSLDDYEEGTWTPQIRPDGYLTAWTATSAGRYTKIGRLVHVTGYVNYTAKTASGNYAFMAGFPFPPATGNETQYFFVTLEGGGGTFYQMGINTSAYGFFIKDNTSGTYGPLTGVELGPGAGTIRFDFVYQI